MNVHLDVHMCTINVRVIWCWQVMAKNIAYHSGSNDKDEVRLMDVNKNSKTLSSFHQGIVLGFASPFLFLGQLPAIQLKRVDNVSRAWRSVGETLRESMNREGARISDKRR
jgi:hypothetical protein